MKWFYLLSVLTLLAVFSTPVFAGILGGDQIFIIKKNDGNSTIVAFACASGQALQDFNSGSGLYHCVPTSGGSYSDVNALALINSLDLNNTLSYAKPDHNTYLKTDQIIPQTTSGILSYPQIGINSYPTNNRFEVKDLNSFTYASISPNIWQTHQGYATDGVYHYTFHTDALYKRNDDANWSVITSNTDPFNSLVGYAHLGDGEYYNGKLYVPTETYFYPGATNPAIFIFDANTLARLQVVDISATATEVSSIAIAPDLNTIFVSDYDAYNIRKYNLETYAYTGNIVTNPNVVHVQGIAYKDGSLYADGDAGLFRIELNGNSTHFNTSGFTWAGAPEGIDFHTNTLRMLLDDAGSSNSRVYYLSPQNITTLSLDKNGLLTVDRINLIQMNLNKLKIGSERDVNDTNFAYYSNTPTNSTDKMILQAGYLVDQVDQNYGFSTAYNLRHSLNGNIWTAGRIKILEQYGYKGKMIFEVNDNQTGTPLTDFSATHPALTLTSDRNAIFSSNVSAVSYYGDGSHLTGIITNTSDTNLQTYGVFRTDTNSLYNLNAVESNQFIGNKIQLGSPRDVNDTNFVYYSNNPSNSTDKMILQAGYLVDHGDQNYGFSTAYNLRHSGNGNIWTGGRIKIVEQGGYRGKMIFEVNDNIPGTPSTDFSATHPVLTLDKDRNATFTSNVTAISYFGDGSKLTGISTTADTNCLLYNSCPTIVYQQDLDSDINAIINPRGYITNYVDTNAQTACGDNEYLRGDGTCQTITSGTSLTRRNLTSTNKISITNGTNAVVSDLITIPYDGFEDGDYINNLIWDVNQGDSSYTYIGVYGTGYAGNYYLRMRQSGANETLTTPISNTTNDFNIYMKANATNSKPNFIIRGLNPSNSQGIYFYDRNAYYISCNDAGTRMGLISNNTWYNARIDINKTANTASYYINDVNGENIYTASGIAYACSDDYNVASVVNNGALFSVTSFDNIFVGVDVNIYTGTIIDVNENNLSLSNMNDYSNVVHTDQTVEQTVQNGKLNFTDGVRIGNQTNDAIDGAKLIINDSERDDSGMIIQPTLVNIFGSQANLADDYVNRLLHMDNNTDNGCGEYILSNSGSPPENLYPDNWADNYLGSRVCAWNSATNNILPDIPNKYSDGGWAAILAQGKYNGGLAIYTYDNNLLALGQNNQLRMLFNKEGDINSYADLYMPNNNIKANCLQLATGDPFCSAPSGNVFGTLTTGKWCDYNGTKVNCTRDSPAAAGSKGSIQINSGTGFDYDPFFDYNSITDTLHVGQNIEGYEDGAILMNSVTRINPDPQNLKGAVQEETFQVLNDNSSLTNLVHADNNNGTASSRIILSNSGDSSTDTTEDAVWENNLIQLFNNGARYASDIYFQEGINDAGYSGIIGQGTYLSKMLFLTYGNADVILGTNNKRRVTIHGDSNQIGFGESITSPSAIVDIQAGSTSAGSAPIKLHSGSLMSSSEAGAIEYNGSAFYGTTNDGRMLITQQPSALTNSRLPFTDSAGHLTDDADLTFTGGNTLNSTGVLANTGSFGYQANTGGSVTQGTSKTTGVTINTIWGIITTHNATMIANAQAVFTVTNNKVDANDMIIINIMATAGNIAQRYSIYGSANPAGGDFNISIRNISGASVSDAIPIQYAILKLSN